MEGCILATLDFRQTTRSDRFPLPQTGNLRLWLAGTACGTRLWRPTVAQCTVPPTARRPFCAQADDAQRARLPEALRQGGVPRSQPRRAALAARAARAAC